MIFYNDIYEVMRKCFFGEYTKHLDRRISNMYFGTTGKDLEQLKCKTARLNIGNESNLSVIIIDSNPIDMTHDVIYIDNELCFIIFNGALFKKEDTVTAIFTKLYAIVEGLVKVYFSKVCGTVSKYGYVLENTTYSKIIKTSALPISIKLMQIGINMKIEELDEFFKLLIKTYPARKNDIEDMMVICDQSSLTDIFDFGLLVKYSDIVL